MDSTEFPGTRFREERHASLVVNDTHASKKVLTTIVRELKRCTSFMFSVAFVTRGGVTSLKQSLLDTSESTRGRLITTDYLEFNDPQALRDLLLFDNIEVRVYTREGFHTKGYIFDNQESSTMLVGSSNLTQEALGRNKEWNVRISSDLDSAAILEAKEEFEAMWEDSVPLTEEWIAEYEPRHIRSVVRMQRDVFKRHNGSIVPNAMQEEALARLAALRSEGKDKALLISATGTGKTYLSAFDVKRTEYSKVLFVVHREQILDAAMESYRNVLAGRSMGKISGSCKDYDADIIFSTVQSMSRDDVRRRFAPDHFEYIVCDEAHHSTSTTYDRIVSYFRPKFMLGMTATPERMDCGDVFEQFDHNIAYEIRLQDALEQEMLCPFHYFGVTDITVDGRPIGDEEDFASLTSDERVRHIVEKARFYGHSGDRVKGLVFCSSIEEGKMLSSKMNGLGLRTCFLCGSDPVSFREHQVDRLEQDSQDGALDYIVTVDVFNEGVDIRSVNQVIMLRPTKSTTVFIQQLGRGLRKTLKDRSTKEFLVVLDFIGNYRNNFMIPMALTGDSSMSREILRRRLMMGSTEIPGCSTVDLDPVSKERIFRSIGDFRGRKTMIKETYAVLAKMLGAPPDLRYLLRERKIDPTVIAKEYGNLNNLREKTKLPCIKMDENGERILTFVTRLTANGKRPHESVILRNIIEHGSIDLETFEEELERMDIVADGTSMESCMSILSGRFSNSLKGMSLISVKDGSVVPSPEFAAALELPGFRDLVCDSVECGIECFERDYSERFDGHFTPFGLYSKSDVCRLLDWKKDNYGAMFGYFVNNHNSDLKDAVECPIFVNYQKSENISSSTKYDDRFVDNQTFSWMSRSNRTLESREIRAILSPECISYLFIRRSGNDDKKSNDVEPYYYIGRPKPVPGSARMGTQKDDDGKDCPIVNILFRLENPVPDEIYDYLVGNLDPE